MGVNNDVLLPMSTSWVTFGRGVVLSYPSRTAGARPVLHGTADGGTTWRALGAPPLPFPADNDQPSVTWGENVLAATDGTQLVTSGDGGHRWRVVALEGAATGAFVAKVVISGGRLLVLATATGTGRSATAVYTGPADGATLRPEPGMSVSGGSTYGDLSSAGGIQVCLGADGTSAHYWIGAAAGRLAPAPRPGPVTDSVLLGGVRQGQPVALACGSPSGTGPGENGKQVYIAPHLGGAFSPSGTVLNSPNQQQFAAASPTAMTIASDEGLAVTMDGGQTWAAKLTQANGSFWTSLAFLGEATGVAIGNTVDDSGNPVYRLYRTADSGRSWQALAAP